MSNTALSQYEELDCCHSGLVFRFKISANLLLFLRVYICVVGNIPQVETMHKRIKTMLLLLICSKQTLRMGGIKQRYTIQSRGMGNGFIATFNKVDCDFHGKHFILFDFNLFSWRITESALESLDLLVLVKWRRIVDMKEYFGFVHNNSISGRVECK